MPYICICLLEEDGLFPSPPFFHYKIVAHSVLGAELLCLPACISYKHPILINLLLAYQKNKNKQKTTVYDKLQYI